MDTKQFLLQVVPDNGTYYLGSVANSKYSEKELTSLDDVMAYITNANKGKRDVYFATSSYNPNTSRAAGNVKSKKALYLDLDCGEGKDFATKQDALAALVKFCKESRMPMPNIIVDSGNGIHVYWVFEEALSAMEWLVLATALKDLTAKLEFKADMSVTADSARIMRIPGTKNHKNGNVKDCKVVSEFGKHTTMAALRKALKPAPLLVTLPDGIGGATNDDLGGGIEFTKGIWHAKYILEQCPTLQQIVLTGGAECTEPLWKQTLNLLAYCEDGAEFIHAVSKKHADYTPEKTIRKFERSVQSAESGKYGPTTCTTFSINPASKCSSCEHSGTCKSPISLGGSPANELPYGYTNTDMGVVRSAQGDEESAVNICPYQITEFKATYQPDGEGGIQLEFLSTIGKADPHRVSIASVHVSDKRSLGGVLSSNNMVLDSRQQQEFSKLMTTWTQQMQAARKVEQPVSNYGWVEANGKTGFSTNNQIFWDDGHIQEVAMADNLLSGQYQPRGSIEPWKKASEYIIKQGRPELICALASGFASPLIKLTGVNGLLLSIVSRQSGTGKSSALKASQSIWGCPIRGINSLHDTTNSVAKRLGALRNLPAYWDELRMQDEIDAFIKLIFQIGQGKEKSRLTQTSAMQDMGTWNTLMTSASNESIYDHILEAVKGSNAGVVRVFEVTFAEAVYKPDLANTQLMFKRLDDNYGNAGPIYGAFLAKNKDKISDKLEAVIESLSKEAKAGSEDRFWINTMGCLLVGAACANSCGLTKFDLPALRKYLLGEFKRMQVTSNEEVTTVKQTINDLLNEFLNVYGDNVYGVEKIPVGRELPKITHLPTRYPVVAMVAEDGGIRLNAREFKRWVYGKRVWNANLFDRMISNGGVKQRKSLIIGLAGGKAQTVGTVIDLSADTLDNLSN